MTKWLKNYKVYLTAGAFLAVILIGVIRYLTGPEYAFSLFYVLPISMVSWHVGRWAGIFLSVLSVTTWLIADLSMANSFSSWFIPYFNETLRFSVFLIITVILSALKSSLEREKALARTDPLTRIANRRAFYELADIEIQRARRYKYPLTIISMDVDNFKTVNDSFGHHVGDTLLRVVAGTIEQSIRAFDVAARLGGDEFAVLLPQTEPEAALTFVERLRQELLATVQKNSWPVTFSIGVVTFTGAISNINDMIKRADNLMYSVKQDGKNMIRHDVVAD